ncbi:MAG TPA: tetratricopeptide repeat protein [Methylomirabilota bacterium]|nr:tetratricopeptide repeat protein [Methylomirabilota bacterium]
MLTTKNLRALSTAAMTWTLLAILMSACAPSGPRALVQGRRLIDAGRYEAALPRLQAATRLLPENAHAFNLLGLAYHGVGRLDQAERAYRTALELDRKLNAARYNLGCLHLDQGNAVAAVRELTSFTLAESSSVEGWLKLASAQLRAGHPVEAERSFRAALALRPDSAEALNGLGVAQAHQRRSLDALASFNAALARDTNFAPALLNAAIVIHQQLNNRAAAAARYRQYAALTPRPPDAEAVLALADWLQSDPVRVLRPVSNPPPAVSSVRTNPPLPATSVVARASSARVPTPPSGGESRLSGSPISETAPVSPKSSVEKTSAVVLAPPPTVSDRASPGRAGMPENRSASVTPRAAVPSAATEGPGIAAASRTAETGPAPVAPAPAAELARPVEPPPARLPLVPTPGPAALAAPRAFVAADEGRPVGTYRYLAPPKPAPGDRRAAEAHFARGVQVHQKALNAQAVTEYEAAIRADPAYFEAHYNLGVALADLGRVRDALAAYEQALAIRPESADARYNFALTLKQGGHPVDAAAELEKLLRMHPTEARARLLVATIYAQQLGQPQRAREHYVRLLELDPRHPEAARIRYWLVSNP